MCELNNDPFNIRYYAQELNKRRDEGRQTTLVLGSRASALFRSADFYTMMQQYGGSPSFGHNPKIKRFKECYTLLTKKGSLNVQEIDILLNRAVGNAPPRLADIYLATLIMQGFFNVVISASIDDFLLQALQQLQMHEEDWQIYDGYIEDYERKDDEPRALDEPVLTRSLLVNVFGQLMTRGYAIPRENYLNDHPDLKGLIQDHTDGDVLCLGFDPVWDGELGEVVHSGRGTFWYINEEDPPFFRDSRGVREIVSWTGPQCSYDYFVENLFPHCGGAIPAHSITQYYIHEILLLRKAIASNNSYTLAT